MKKTLALALLLSSISYGAVAQQTRQKETRAEHKRTELVDKTAEEIAKKKTDHIDKEVQLTEKQRKEVYALYLKEAKAKIEAEEKASLTQSSGSKTPKSTSDVEVHKLLTPDQQKKLTDKKNNKKVQKSGKSKNIKS